MRNIWADCVVQSAENCRSPAKGLTFPARLRYNIANQTLLRQIAEDKPLESAHLTERMLTR